MDYGNPCNRTTSLKNKATTSEASEAFLHGIKCAILEYLSTTTNIESKPHCVLGNPSTKSLLKSSQGLDGIGNNVYNPVFCFEPFPT